MNHLSYKRIGKGYPLVLVHGYLGGQDMWKFQEQNTVAPANLVNYYNSISNLWIIIDFKSPKLSRCYIVFDQIFEVAIPH